MGLKQTLTTNLEVHAKEEGQLSAQWENAENNYQSNLDAYDQEMHVSTEKIAQAEKEHEEYHSQLKGLKEEYGQRLDEQRKRDSVKGLIKKYQEQQAVKED